MPTPAENKEEDDKSKKGRSRRGKDASTKAEAKDTNEQPKKKGFFGRLFGKK